MELTFIFDPHENSVWNHTIIYSFGFIKFLFSQKKWYFDFPKRSFAKMFACSGNHLGISKYTYKKKPKNRLLSKDSPSSIPSIIAVKFVLKWKLPWISDQHKRDHCKRPPYNHSCTVWVQTTKSCGGSHLGFPIHLKMTPHDHNTLWARIYL